ncbi:MYXO-CTERM sorting domain-containing protein [Myxococcus sp. K15C18031901]|uniref:MYXO-CTERM sorting domain-containing protein n=1 Tax=Myxococcus dinghuensis TaxID=2906761 RepID=UPI0020A70B2D|nr:MYXO-CTERM sorting domain-containing protein [Myxococcus dinghuensis]MCP3098047.1 MYXO-CTERM sorting domain-containing protein [Myxococcus dinghuensis]
MAQQLVDAGPPFGLLPLIDEVNCGNPSDPHPVVHGANSTSQVRSLTLDGVTRTVRSMTMGQEAKSFSYKLGAGKGLQAGKAYLLVVEYPDDEARMMAVANKGADKFRGFSTGNSIGDFREQYAYPNPESLKYPLSRKWQQFRQFFYLHDRFAPVVGQRELADTQRPDSPADGFWVSVGHFARHGSPIEKGTAVSRIRLFEVPNPASLNVAINYPPAPLPRRHVFWREEMNDDLAICSQGAGTGCEPGASPATWFDYRMKQAKFLGIDTYSHDLMEFGHTEGWNAEPFSAPPWYVQPSDPTIWASAVARAAANGFSVLPYYEYTGAIGGEPVFGNVRCAGEDDQVTCKGVSKWHSCRQPWMQPYTCGLPPLGEQRRCERLFNEQNNSFYSAYNHSDANCVDVTDPEALADVKKVMDATLLHFKSQVTFLGAWFRTRATDLPVSFGPETLARFSSDTGQSVSKPMLQTNLTLRAQYYAWWLGKRKAFLVAIRDYLRQNGVANAQVLFTPYMEEPLPTPELLEDMSRVVTDDPALWEPIDQNCCQPGDTTERCCEWRYPSVTPAEFLQGGVYRRAITTDELPPSAHLSNEWGEPFNSVPPADPDAYKTTEGIFLTYPFGRLFSVADPTLMNRFRGASGLAAVHHFPLNEDDGKGDYANDVTDDRYGNWPMGGLWGYLSMAVDRQGPYSMLAEARAVANGDPTLLGYLEPSSISRGFPEYTRAFHAAFLALPALPSAVVAGAASDAEVVVRKISTAQGNFYAVVNTSMQSKQGVDVTLPGETQPITDRVSQTVTTGKGLSLYPGQLLAWQVGGQVAPPADGGTPSDAGTDPGCLATTGMGAPARLEELGAGMDAESGCGGCSARGGTSAVSLAVLLALAVLARRRRA